MISFICNICGQANTLAAFHHEESTCNGCGSNVRLRALVYMLSVELFGDGFLLPEFPCLPAIKGLGLSDQLNYAERLAEKFDYTNTFYDREPHLDITAAHPESYGTYDFILSSDVFEHIAPPVQRAFDEAYKLLKPHGLLCLSVPFSLLDSTIERFPGLHEFAVVPLGGTPVLINRTREGALEIRDDLVFHGGEGATLEMRIFSHKDLENKLKTAGFKTLKFLTEAIPEFGIFFEGGCSLPLVARKEDFVFDRRTIGQLAKEYNARNKDLAELRSLQAKSHAHIDRLDEELATRGVWATGLQQEIEEARATLNRLQTEFDERTRWALQLRDELEAHCNATAALRAQLDVIAESRWIKLGNRLGLGPKLKPPT
jgi:SAM-dependent methyltransferase